MTYDPTATYRATQVASSSPANRIVLLYQGAIRFGTQHVTALGRGDLEGAHRASIRCQAIVAGLQETLDPAAGSLAIRLDQLYGFVLRRLVEGNLTKTAGPTEEALTVLRDLLGTWQEIAGLPIAAAGPLPQARPAAVPAVPAVMSFPQAVIAGGCGLPRNRALRARLQPHLDADPELLAALLVHLELARDLQAPVTTRPAEPAGTTAARRPPDPEPR